MRIDRFLLCELLIRVNKWLVIELNISENNKRELIDEG